MCEALLHEHVRQVLIIDEVSMISAELFEQLEAQARAIMGNETPFGGIQLLLSGDYYQCETPFNPIPYTLTLAHDSPSVLLIMLTVCLAMDPLGQPSASP